MKSFTKNIHIIGGAGKLSQSLISGLLASRRIHPEQITISGPHTGNLQVAANRTRGIRYSTKNLALARRADIVILAVKPAMVLDVACEFATKLRQEQVVVSCAAAIPLATIATIMQHEAMVRVMPNLGMKIGVSSTGMLFGKGISGRQRQIITKLFQLVGHVHELPTDASIDNHTITSGTGTATVAKLLQSLEQAGIFVGENRELSHSVVLEVCEGVIALIQSGCYKSFDSLIRDVETPGGTTVHTIHSLEQASVPASIVDAIKAGRDRIQQVLDEIFHNLKPTPVSKK